jgi:hypothetical protein
MGLCSICLYVSLCVYVCVNMYVCVSEYVCQYVFMSVSSARLLCQLDRNMSWLGQRSFS